MMKRLAAIILVAMTAPALAQQQATPSQMALQVVPIIENWAAAAEALPLVQKQLAEAQKQVADLQKQLDELKAKK